MMLVSSDNVRIADMKTIEAQLDREPRGLAAVTSRCAHGCPQVVETDPLLEDGKPFPTLFWLTCPVLVKAVARLEDGGWAEKLGAMMGADPALYARLEAAHDDYRARRRAGAAEGKHPVFDTGIGGVRDLKGIKCLHAHYAHYLSTGVNPVGEMVDSAIGEVECDARCDAR